MYERAPGPRSEGCPSSKGDRAQQWQYPHAKDMYTDMEYGKGRRTWQKNSNGVDAPVVCCKKCVSNCRNRKRLSSWRKAGFVCVAILPNRTNAHAHTHANARTHAHKRTLTFARACTQQHKHTHKHTHTCARTHTRSHAFTRKCTNANACAQIHSHAHTHMHMHARVHTRLRTHKQACERTCTHARTHTHAHTHTHTRTHYCGSEGLALWVSQEGSKGGHSVGSCGVIVKGLTHPPTPQHGSTPLVLAYNAYALERIAATACVEHKLLPNPEAKLEPRRGDVNCFLAALTMKLKQQRLAFDIFTIFQSLYKDKDSAGPTNDNASRCNNIIGKSCIPANLELLLTQLSNDKSTGATRGRLLGGNLLLYIAFLCRKSKIAQQGRTLQKTGDTPRQTDTTYRHNVQ